MPEYLAPGVYIEEVSSGLRPIEGVSTSNAGFAGGTARGPMDVRLVTSFPEFERLYGGVSTPTSASCPSQSGAFSRMADGEPSSPGPILLTPDRPTWGQPRSAT